jgi:hypothetical protein
LLERQQRMAGGKWGGVACVFEIMGLMISALLAAWTLAARATRHPGGKLGAGHAQGRLDAFVRQRTCPAFSC